MSDEIKKIDVDLLVVKDQLHRTKLDISSMVESLQLTGQINPIIAKKVGNKFEVLAGRRRTAAWKSIQAMTGKKQKAMVIVRDLSQLEEELITIDENIMRQQLGDDELDEALFRRKQIYEELHPETRQGAAGGHGKQANKDKETKTKAFSVDAAEKLSITRRTVERSIARASKASEAVRKARKSGELSVSKVDLLVTFKADEQEMLLPFIKRKDVAEGKKLVERAKKVGAKAAILYLNEEEGDLEDPRDLKMLTKEAKRLTELLDDALKSRKVFASQAKFDHIRAIEHLSERLAQFADFQRSALGAVRAIRRRGSETKVIRSARS